MRHVLTAAPSTAARRAFRQLFTEVVRLRSLQSAQTIEATDRMNSGFELGQHFARGPREPPSVGAFPLERMRATRVCVLSCQRAVVADSRLALAALVEVILNVRNNRELSGIAQSSR